MAKIISEILKELDDMCKSVFKKKNTNLQHNIPLIAYIDSMKVKHELKFRSFPIWKQKLYKFIHKINIFLLIFILFMFIIILFS